MTSNTEALLDDIYERQKLKFGNATKAELYKKLRCEIREYQAAIKAQFNNNSVENSHDVMFEIADIIIVANRLYKEFKDEIAWALLIKYYNYETARYVKAKWDIVEKRKYVRDQYGNWQHIEE
jgi:hypothetical protein